MRSDLDHRARIAKPFASFKHRKALKLPNCTAMVGVMEIIRPNSRTLSRPVPVRPEDMTLRMMAKADAFNRWHAPRADKCREIDPADADAINAWLKTTLAEGSATFGDAFHHAQTVMVAVCHFERASSDGPPEPQGEAARLHAAHLALYDIQVDHAFDDAQHAEFYAPLEAYCERPGQCVLSRAFFAMKADASLTPEVAYNEALQALWMRHIGRPPNETAN